MKYTLTLVAGLAVLLALTLNTAARPVAAAAGSTYYYNFNEDVKPWLPATDNGSTNSVIERLTGSNGCPDMLGKSGISSSLCHRHRLLGTVRIVSCRIGQLCPGSSLLESRRWTCGACSYVPDT